MKNIKPLTVALITSFLTSLSGLFSLFIVAYSNGASIDYKLLVLLTLFIFATTFGIIYYFLEMFIYQRIKLIYKSIFNVKTSNIHKNSSLLDNDAIAKVEEDVDEWARENRKELDTLKRMEKFRREFLGNVSHELRTPIFNVQGYIETLLDGGLEDPNINRKYLENANKNINRLSQIVDDLNLISENDNDNLEIIYTSFNVVELIEELMSSMEMSAQDKGIKLMLNNNSLLSCAVIADKNKITQVLINLITNSLKYASIGGETNIGVYDMESYIMVEVTDNGIGIEEEHLPRVFERFYRVESARSREQGGSGLGLSIVKHIIDGHNQSINVRSIIGVGTAFSFTLKKG